MLPDYPDLKAKLMHKLVDEMRENATQAMGFFSRIPRIKVFEGDRLRIKREDLSVQEAFLEKKTASMTFTEEELNTANPALIKNKMESVAQEIAEERSKSFIQTIDQEISAVGNVVNAPGQPFSIELFFELFEKMYIEFDHTTGKPYFPTIVADRRTIETSKKELAKLASEPYEKRFKELLEKKKGEWLARESNRKLVG